jgi:hypothetical protein
MQFTMHRLENRSRESPVGEKCADAVKGRSELHERVVGRGHAGALGSLRGKAAFRGD